jgi:hypothetical protein
VMPDVAGANAGISLNLSKLRTGHVSLCRGNFKHGWKLR